jgi:hypothetical protein
VSGQDRAGYLDKSEPVWDIDANRPAGAMRFVRPPVSHKNKIAIMAKSKKAKQTIARRTLDPSLPIFQLKITLENIEPPIWRRIQTHNCSLADLHDIIQSCIGWEDEHMYAFEVGDRQYTDLSRGADRYEFRDSRSVRLSKLVEQGQHDFVYEYDFGDSWRHAIEIESTLPPEETARYPRCLDGQRAGPPEDCGGSYGYDDLLDALAHPDREDEDYDERLEWLDDFDPEAFSVEEVNKEFLHLRRWLGRHPRLPGQVARFAVGDRVRARPGVVHSQYPDIPLGGWVGTVTQIAWLIPLSYEIRWTEDTLAAAHPVYGKRCRRDDAEPAKYWLDEGEMEPDSAEQPVEMEQPANLVAKPLSADDQDDRIRMVFGLTSDDPLLTKTDETEQQYLEYLKAHLAFPFSATQWSKPMGNFVATKLVTVVGFASPTPIDLIDGVLCEVRCEQETEQVPLNRLELDESDPNYRYVDDYKYWRWDVHDFAHDADEADEEYGDEEEDAEKEDETWHDDDEEDYEYDEEDFGPPLIADPDDGVSGPQPIRREQPPVGRNDPCPCGSGKKFKKCCLKRQSNL